MLSSDQAAAAIVQGAKDELVRLRRELSQNPEAANQILRELAGHREMRVRHWVTWAAPRCLGSAATEVLELLTSDTNSDVRLDAMRALVDLDARWARRLAPRYLEMLRSEDVIEQVQAIWRLVQFREQSALTALNYMALNDRDAGIRNNAGVAFLVLQGDDDSLLEGLRRHDHELMFLWTKGLGYLGTDRAFEALATFAKTGPDEECRAYARDMLEVRDQVRPLMIH
jgi:hypothetical protein